MWCVFFFSSRRRHTRWPRDWSSDVCSSDLQQRAGDEIIALDRDTAAERTLQHIRDGDALPRAGVEMLDEGHVHVAGQQREFHRAKLVESPALSAAARGD